MDRKAVAKRLRLLATNDEKRSKASRLRDVLDEVEMALRAGARRMDIVAELNALGLQMSLATFETTLKRLRARRSRGRAAGDPYTSSVQAQPTLATTILENGETGDQPSHDPTDLDRIIATQPNLAALARLAKGSKK